MDMELLDRIVKTFQNHAEAIQNHKDHIEAMEKQVGDILLAHANTIVTLQKEVNDLKKAYAEVVLLK